MDRLPPEISAFLEEAGSDDNPRPADQNRVRRRLALALGASSISLGTTSADAVAKSSSASGAQLGANAGLTNATGVSASSITSLGAKLASQVWGWIAVVSVTGATITGAPHLVRWLRTSSSQATAHADLGGVSNESVLGATSETAAFHVSEPSHGPTTPTQASPASLPLTIPEASTASPRSARLTAELVAPPSQRTTSSREITLLADAQRALGRHDASRALNLTLEHQRSYPNSALVAERLAMRVFALCDLERHSDARRAARSFYRVAAHSPFEPRVRTSCAGQRINNESVIQVEERGN